MITEKLKEVFGGMIVNKSSVQGIFSALSIPSFLRDWFLKRYCNADGSVEVEYLSAKIKETFPRRNDWNGILDELMTGGGRKKFIAKVKLSIDIRTANISFELPDFGVSASDTVIPSDVWNKCKSAFLAANGDVWGVVDLSYRLTPKGKGEIVLNGFTSFRPYKIDLEYYKRGRAQFTTDEWIEVLLGAVDYNAESIREEKQRLTMLSRLLPFVEKRLNLIELAPKGTGKSYMFSQISKRGWLASGGVMTRAKMFFDMSRKEEGLVCHYDYVALDEISTIRFSDAGEMLGALKGYLESGQFMVGNKTGSGDAGVVLLGNIPVEQMDESANLFRELPALFQESALLDRFHGFIKGWDIPRMNERMKADGWALNCEYFAEILHELRSDLCAKTICDGLIAVSADADTRDVNAVKRICSAWLKLLFPHWKTADDADPEEFEKYCLRPAVAMRSVIKRQLGIIDSEFQSRPMPQFSVN